MGAVLLILISISGIVIFYYWQRGQLKKREEFWEGDKEVVSKEKEVLPKGDCIILLTGPSESSRLLFFLDELQKRGWDFKSTIDHCMTGYGVVLWDNGSVERISTLPDWVRGNTVVLSYSRKNDAKVHAFVEAVKL